MTATKWWATGGEGVVPHRHLADDPWQLLEGPDLLPRLTQAIEAGGLLLIVMTANREQYDASRKGMLPGMVGEGGRRWMTLP